MGGPYRQFKIRPITPDQLRAEGVIEIGRADGTSVVFVRTEIGLHLFHAGALPDRSLDGYAITLAVNWLEAGHPAYEVAANLDVHMDHLASELSKAGYERVCLNDQGPRLGSTERRRRKAGPRAHLVKVGPGKFRYKGPTYARDAVAQ